MTEFDILPESKRDFLIWKGIALELIQSTEGLLTDVVTMVFHPSSSISRASLETEEIAQRRKTLGQLLSELKCRADVHPQLETVFEKFLVGRNEFIHHFREIERAQGREAALLLTKRVIADAWMANQALMAIFVFWARGVEANTEGLTLLPPDGLPAELFGIEAAAQRVPCFVRPKRM